jgi:cytochrome c biogenesis protein CcmG, thiol:disulfide interchange protein DsbE
MATTRARPPAKRGRRPRRRLTVAHAAYVTLGLATIAGAVLLFRSSSSATPAAQPPPEVEVRSLAAGQPAPDFTATTFGGGKLTLSALRGKVVMVNFFASWCTSCAHELPGIQSEYRLHAGQGFTVVGVNSLENGDGVSFYRSYGLTFPAVYDPGNPGRIGAAYHVTNGLPASIFIDRAGRVDLIIPGEVTTATIEAELKKLLAA